MEKFKYFIQDYWKIICVIAIVVIILVIFIVKNKKINNENNKTIPTGSSSVR